MEVAHGGFEGFVAHGLLDGARVGAAFEAVGGVAVAQFVWEDGYAKFSPGVLDGALDIGFVHSEAHQGVGARVIGLITPGRSLERTSTTIGCGRASCGTLTAASPNSTFPARAPAIAKEASPGP